MKKYWSSLPEFRYVENANICAMRVKEYFGVDAIVLRKEDCDDDKSVAKMMSLLVNFAKDLENNPQKITNATWHVFYQTNDKEKDLLIECFIVAWARGFEDGDSIALGKASNKNV